MASAVKSAYGNNNQTITITLASLASAGQRQSTVVDNTSNLFLDALVTVKSKSNASGVSATGYLNVYAFGTTDGGTNYADGAGASDAGITLPSPPNMKLIGQVTMNANATTYTSEPMSVAAAFGGDLPDHWGITVENLSGATLDATGGNHLVDYQGQYANVG